MRRRVATRLALLASVVAVAVPILAALYLAHSQSMEEESRQALAMAGEVLRRAERAAEQAVAADEVLHRTLDGDPCSEAGMARMRDVDLASSYLDVVGYVVDDRLRCSSLGDHGEGLVLGPAQYVSTFGARVRPAVDLGIDGRRFLLLERDGHAVAIHPEALIDLYLDRPNVSLGTFGASSGRAMSRRGPFDPEAEPRLRDAARSVYFNGRHLVAIRRSERFDVASYAAVPVEYLRGRIAAFAVVLVPIGVVLGGLLAFACLNLARRRASLPSVLHGALRNREIVMYYQPIVALDGGRVVGAEALLRWPRGEGDGLRPDAIVAAAEDCGLIGQVTAYVIERVREDAPRLLADWPDGYISINLASADLHSDAIVESLRRLVSTQGIRPHNIIVEATEHSFVDPASAARIVREIRALGIRVGIDDFGTGYSSLSYLTSLKTDFLKIDRTFVEAVGTDAVTRYVAQHIIGVAATLDLQAIAEGVETEVQAAFLREHGVPLAQGWLFGAAMPPDEFLRHACLGQRESAPAQRFEATAGA